MLLFLTGNLVAQTELPFTVIDDRVNKYAFAPQYEEFDTSIFVDKKYENGQIKRLFFFNDSLWLDSVFQYHENGQLSSSEIIDKYTPIKNVKQNVSYYMPNETLKTYYPSGNIRSEEYLSYSNDSKYFSYVNVIYLDSMETPLYDGIIDGPDTLGGIYQLPDTVGVKYCIYDSRTVVSTWRIDPYSVESPIVMEVIDHLKNKRYRKTKQLEKLIKKYNFYWINEQLIIKKK